MADPVLDPWEVKVEGYPRAGTTADQLTYLLNYAVLAPSGHNTQPWRFQVRDDTVEVFADRSAALPIIDPYDRELIMSCGAALFNLRVAVRYFGHKDDVELVNELKRPDLLARVRMGHPREATAEDKQLFEAITKRRTNRRVFENRPVPDALLAELQMAANQEGAWLHIIEGEGLRNAVADLVADGNKQQWADVRFRRELQAWTHPTRELRRDGIPSYASGVAETVGQAGPAVVRTFDLGNGQAAKDRDLAIGSPALAVLGTDGDTQADWVAAGQALERVVLRACAAGLSHSYLNQPIEVEALRPRLAQLLDRVGYPQNLLRFGYGTDVKPTPRRMVHDVLETGYF